MWLCHLLVKQDELGHWGSLWSGAMHWASFYYTANHKSVSCVTTSVSIFKMPPDNGSKQSFSIFILNSYAVPCISSRTRQDTQTEHGRIWGAWKGWGHKGGRTKRRGKTQPARGRWCKLWEPVWRFVCVHPWNWLQQQLPRASPVLQTASTPTPTGDCCLATGKTSFHLTR